MFRLIFKEIMHRKTNFLLSFLAIVIAVILYVSFYTISNAAHEETTKIQLMSGFNVRIIPRETDMNKFWARGFSEYTMSEEVVGRFQDRKGVSYNHLLAFLHKEARWRDKDVILTGISSDEVIPPGKPKRPILFSVKKGTAYVGFELARSLDLKRNDVIELFGKSFKVEKTLSDTGTHDNIRIYGHLHDVQEILNLRGKINEIKAVECMCSGVLKAPVEGRIEILRRQLSKFLPEAKVIELKQVATARQKQRKMAKEYFALIVPFVVVVCGAWIGVLAMMNVRERRNEIGVFRALGFESGKIATLFLGKAAIIGILGALAGFIIGTGLSIEFGTKIFVFTAHMIKPIYQLLWRSLVGAPVFAALSSLIPAMLAVAQDPASVMSEE